MQLTAVRAHRVPPRRPAPKADAPRSEVRALEMRLLLRDPTACVRAPMFDWVQRGQVEVPQGSRKGSALALAISAALHAALLLSLGGVLVAPKIAPVEASTSNVVYVNLPQKVSQRSATASPASSPVTRSQRFSPPAPHAAYAESASRMPVPSALPALAVESAEAGLIAEPVPSRDGSPGVSSQPDRVAVTPAQVASEISTPAYLFAPEPEYPRSAREEGEEGLVVLRILVSSKGRPVEIRISRTSGSRVLDAAAVTGVKRWTFVAAKQGGRSIDAWMDVPIRFHLR